MGQVIFKPRSFWDNGSRPRLGHVIPHAQVIGLAIHHTVFIMADWDRDGIIHGDLDDIKTYMRRLQTSRPDLGLDVPYSFVVFELDDIQSCIVVEGRGAGRTGAHTAGYNSTRYGVAFAGNTSTRAITPGMVSGVKWVGSILHSPHTAKPAILHRDTSSTECPGNSAAAHRQEFNPPYILSTGADDMIKPGDRGEVVKDLSEMLSFWYGTPVTDVFTVQLAWAAEGMKNTLREFAHPSVKHWIGPGPNWSYRTWYIYGLWAKAMEQLAQSGG